MSWEGNKFVHHLEKIPGAGGNTATSRVCSDQCPVSCAKAAVDDFPLFTRTRTQHSLLLKAG